MPAPTTRSTIATLSTPPASSRTICAVGFRSILLFTFPKHKIRLISPDVGGGFGVKVISWSKVPPSSGARSSSRRPVKWTATRSEALLSDAQARDHLTKARMGFAADGRIVAMQIDTLAALGGYLSNFAPSRSPAIPIRRPSPASTRRRISMAPSPRRLHQHAADRRLSRLGPAGGDLDNERLIELGARALDLDVIEIRRRNLHPDIGFSLSGAGRPHLRFRRSAGAARQAARSRRLPRLAARAGEAARTGHPDGHRPRLLHRQGRHRRRAAISPSGRRCMAAGKARSCASTATARS